MNYLPLLKASSNCHELKHEGLIFIIYYFQSASCFQGQPFASKLAKRPALHLKAPPAHTQVFPTWSHLAKFHKDKNELSQQHVLLKSQLSWARERGVVFKEDSRSVHLDRAACLPLVTLAGRMSTWVSFSTGCWQEIDSSNVPGTQTCRLPSRW